MEDIGNYFPDRGRKHHHTAATSLVLAYIGNYFPDRGRKLKQIPGVL